METPIEKIKRLQNLHLADKIKYSLYLIIEWYEAWDGDVCVSFSGGKDSTVLLNLVQKIYPNVKIIFCNTGLEYPEILKFVKTYNNVTWIHPKKTFKQIIEYYGYPVVSKEVAMGLDRYRNTKYEVQKQLRLHGGINPTTGRKQQPSIPKKWKFLIYAPFKISEKCCYHLKKYPMKSMKNPYIGNTYSDSNLRRQQYIRNNGCGQLFNRELPQSHPLYFWASKDIWQYLKIFSIPYSKIYDMGEKRTGCMFCMFGVHFEKGENRFQRMKHTHPKHWNYCINKLNLRLPLEYMEIPYK